MIGLIVSGIVMVASGIALTMYVRRLALSESSPREDAICGLAMLADGGVLDSDEAARVRARIADLR